MNSYAFLNPGYSDGHSSSLNAPTPMLQRPGGDSGYHDCQHSESCSCSNSLPYVTGSFQAPNHQQNPAIRDFSFGKGPSLIQGSVSSVLAKYEKSLHAYYEDNGRKMPDVHQLLLLSGLIQAPAPAVRARFQQYLEMDNYSSGSYSYSDHNSQTFLAIPEETEPNLPMHTYTSAVLLDAPALIVGQHSSTYVADAFQLRDDEQAALAIMDGISGVEVEPPSGTEISSTPELTRPERVTWTPSLASLISRIIDARKERGCGLRVSRHGTGKYHCTSGCGGRFNTSHDWIRHENLRYMQSLWFCIQCGNLDAASEKHLFYREDKFRDHVRQHHPTWIRPGRLGQCKVPNNPSRSFPHRCGFCNQKGFRDWAHRCNHLTAHFKAGLNMALWHSWPEDELEEDDDDDDDLIEAEPDVPRSDDDNDDNDDDDDDDDDDGDDARYEAQFHNSPPPGSDTDHNQDKCFRDAFEEGGYIFDNSFFDVASYGNSSRIMLSPLPDHQNLETAPQSTQYILPVLSKGRVNWKGGTGSVYEIEVLNTHLPQSLEASGSYDTDTSHIFAVKTYQNKYRRTFDRELAAYTKLNYLDRNHHNILRCLGSFTQQPSGGPTYNLLLEYAECDLDEYFEHTPSPDSLESIRWLWEQLFGVADGLRTIHDGLGTGDQGRTYFGYHADLKPANILRVGSRWKIADFGFSKFIEAEDDQLPEQIMDGGTCMYNAPECRRSITDNTVVPVSQKIDVWSMGCVLSKAATWIILGISGVRDFEKHLSAAEDQRALARFHDGKNVLPSVQTWHKILRQNIHTKDHLTGKILDLVDNHLLQGDPRSRFDSKELCAYLGQLLQEREETPPSIAQGPFPMQSVYFNPDGMLRIWKLSAELDDFANVSALRWAEGCFVDFQIHVANALSIDVVYIQGLGSQQGQEFTKRPSAWRIAEKFEKIDSTLEKSVKGAGLFRGHRIIAFSLDRNAVLHAYCTQHTPENTATRAFFESDYKPYETMSPKNVFVAHSLGGLIVKVSLSTPTPDLCSVDHCHNRYHDRFIANPRYSDFAWQLRLNDDGSHHCKVPNTALPQWFRPECPPGEWSVFLDLMNRFKDQYKLFLTFGFRTERWDHQVAGPRQNSWNEYEEYAPDHDGHDFDASGYNMYPDLRQRKGRRLYRVSKPEHWEHRHQCHCHCHLAIPFQMCPSKPPSKISDVVRSARLTNVIWDSPNVESFLWAISIPEICLSCPCCTCL